MIRSRIFTFSSILCLGLTWGAYAGAKEIDFTEGLDRLVANDPQLASQNRLAKSQSVALEADRQAALPSFKINLNQRQVDAWNHGIPTQESSYWEGVLDVNIYHFGQDKARFQLAEHGAQRYEASQQKDLLIAQKQASDKLIAFLFRSFDRSVLQKLNELRIKLSMVASKQFQTGRLAQQEYEKIDLDQKTIELQLNNADALTKQAEADINFYLGSDSIRKEWPLAHLVISKDASKLAYIFLQSQDQHPMLEEARRALAMEQKRVDILWSSLMPSLDAQALIGKPVAGDLPQNGSSQYLLSLSIPIYDRGVYRAEYHAQQERTASANYNLSYQENALKIRLKKSTIAIEENLRSIKSYEQLLGTARKLYKDSLLRFGQGLVTVNDLSVDETRLYNAERDTLLAWYSLHINWSDACNQAALSLSQCWKKGYARDDSSS